MASALMLATTSGSRAQSVTSAPGRARRPGQRRAPGAAADDAVRFELHARALSRSGASAGVGARPRPAASAAGRGVEPVGEAQRQPLGAGQAIMAALSVQ